MMDNQLSSNNSSPTDDLSPRRLVLFYATVLMGTPILTVIGTIITQPFVSNIVPSSGYGPLISWVVAGIVSLTLASFIIALFAFFVMLRILSN